MALDRAVREAEESRGLWEMEVKSRSKLGMKVLEMERSQGDVNTLMDVVSAIMTDPLSPLAKQVVL